MKHEPETYLVTKQLAEMICVSTSFLEKGRAYGYGPTYIKIGGKVLYPLSECEDWLNSNRVRPEGFSND